jgi:hypothetical protein
LKALTEAVDYVKTDLMPDFDFDAYNHDQAEGAENDGEYTSDITESIAEPITSNVVIVADEPEVIVTAAATNGTTASEEVDKW